MSSVRYCRIDGCMRKHERSLFCCKTHWFQLPRELRNAIWDAYRNGGPMTNAYMQAAENGEAYLEDRDAEDVGEVFS